MAPKPKRSWFDIQMAIMTISMASVLGLWNLFAGPDRETALRKAAEAQASQPEPVDAPPPTPEPIVIATAVAPPQPGEKILLGGTEPQTQVIIQNNRGGGGGGGGGVGGGGPVTSTSSS
jgi:hypothetical protein